MTAKDKIHDAVKNALIKDGWTITHDPLTIEFEDAQVFIDLGAERVLAAERKGEKIAVEIKSFIGRSAIHDMEVALGQYVLYLSFLTVNYPKYTLYIAISRQTYRTIFHRKSIQFLVKHNQIPLIVVDVATEEIIEWITN